MSTREVRAKTLGEIRSFLDEISNGTSRYRSLHNLTEQVEHQYHGRFLIELVQNAHDALSGAGVMDPPQRIEIMLAEDEQPEGALYMANDGQPFTSSNFRALANLGQSDKDPRESIGNKGIGFRSVLEMTKAPEIYSRKNRESASFDGYCFAFQPEVIEVFKNLIHRVAGGDNTVELPEAFGGGRLLEWDDTRFDNFRERCRAWKSDWIREELACLSPYALPVPLDMEQVEPGVADFEKRGFSTVVRLPFLSEHARKIAAEKLEEINASTAIFLPRVDVLRLTTKSHDKCYRREQQLLNDDPEEGFEVMITSSETGVNEEQGCCRSYWLWKRKVGGQGRPGERDEIQSAVTDLPGRWKEVDEATVEIAVQTGSDPDYGVLNIYLPTRLPSGCAAHFSAPFYGDMSRTSIDFQHPYNSFLLATIAEKGVDVMLNSLPVKGEAGAAAIIDILAPADCDAGQRWWNALEKVFDDRAIEIENRNIALSDEGWHSLACTRLLPERESTVVIDDSLMRSEATYPVFVQTLKEREHAIRRIFEEIYINPEASVEDKAATVEAIARKLHDSQQSVCWTGFWQDVESQFEDPEPLRGKKILLGTDHQLHACDGRCSVFFRPRRDEQDSEVSDNVRIEDIPETLRSFAAFLHEDIQTHISRKEGGIKTTATHGYLSGGLVEAYGVERIFNSVLVKAVPELPHDIDGPKSRLCQDILTWALRLLRASNDGMKEPIRLLGRLPAPCIGGWYPVNETSFGPGWTGKSGDKLEEYLRQVATPECSTALKRLLLAPDDSLWGGVGLPSMDVLEKAGTFNGIRLVLLKEEDWNAQFTMSCWTGVELPEKSPSVYSAEVWKAYREHIKDSEKPLYTGEFDYEMGNVYALPGFEKIDDFDDTTHKSLMDLLLESITSWGKYPEKWDEVKINKVSGQKHRYDPISPLKFSLMNTKWMQGEIDNETIRFRPSDRWYIPSSASAGGIHQFSHLMPIPVSVVSVFGGNTELVASMKNLGMPIFDPEEETKDPRLLNDLAAALENPKIDISNRSVFLGQIRTSWRQFHPSEEDPFPDQIMVERSSKNFKVETPSQDNLVYLPDAEPALHDGLRRNSMSIIVIDQKDAKRLKGLFQNVYPNGVRLSSDLTTRALVDGHQWQAQNNERSLSEELPWLIPIVLSIFAFSGGQVRGVDTKTFGKAIDALRRTRIVWVDTLDAEISHEGDLVASTPVPALWSSDNDTLLATRETRTRVGELSEELESIVERNDISTSLRLVLKDFESTDKITEDIVYKSIRQVNITEDQYQEVVQRWLGDLSWSIRLGRVLILLMQPEADTTRLDAVSTQDDFQDALKSYGIDLPNLNRIVHDSSGLKSAGHQAWEIFGNRAQLSQWNKVLLRLGESPVLNDEANEQFSAHMESCRKMMGSIISSTLRKHPEDRGFKDFEADLNNLQCPEEYAEKYWVVGFPEVLQELRKILVKWDADLEVVTLFERVASADELGRQLERLGHDPKLDPVAIHSENDRIFLRVLEEVRKSCLAWCIRENSEVGIMQVPDEDAVKGFLRDDFAKSAYIDVWDEAKCLQLIGKLNRSQIHEGFGTPLDKSSTVAELKNRLEITDADLEGVHDRFEAYKHRQELQRKTVEVCGKDFVNSDGNLRNLWDHIVGEIEDYAMTAADLGKLDKLEDQESSKRRGNSGTKAEYRKKSEGKISQAMKSLVGLAGEIHAFRVLKERYGETVGSGNWISGNSTYRYPENTTDDSFGCDFRICKDGKTYFIEVKATLGNAEVFELGSSEVKLAIDAANRRKEEFVIWHVLDALSANPVFRRLPNPYNKRYRSKYRFEEAGLRVRYNTV